MASGNYSATNANGVNYNLIYNNGLFGVGASYTMTVTYPDGTSKVVSNIPAANVLTTSGGTLTIASVLLGSTYVVPPGVTGTVTIGVALATATPNVIDVGGTATIQTIVAGLSGLTVNVDGGTATATSGVLGSNLSGVTVNLDNGGTFGNGSSLVSILDNTTVNFGTGGGDFVANAGGAILNLSSVTINGFDNSKDFIQFKNLPQDSVSTYSIVSSGASQLITAYDSSGKVISSVTVAGQNFAPATYSVNGVGPLTVTDSGTTLTIEPLPTVCFLAGSMIRLVSGEREIESVQVGDQLLAYAEGSDKPVDAVWTGSRRVVVRRDQPMDLAGYPVRIRKDAIAEAMPSQDLLVTPEHCIFIDGKLIPSRMLVNGRSVLYDTDFTSYQVYHVEARSHAIIRANGLLTESYLDTGNRNGFSSTSRGSDRVVSLAGPQHWNSDAAAPLCVDRLTVEAIWNRLAERAALLGYTHSDGPVETTEDPDLAIVTSTGATIRPILFDGRHHAFVVPAHSRKLRLNSRASRACDSIGPFLDDRRRLGVLVGDIVVSCGKHMVTVGQHLDLKLSDGWHGIERGPISRWTDGSASLPIEAQEKPLFVTIEIIAGGPYCLDTSLRSQRMPTRDAA